MNPVKHIEPRVQNLFTPIIGKIRIKTYFSYYGIFSGKFMFALYKDDYLFLRTNAETKREVCEIEGTFILNDPLVGVKTKNFYAIPFSKIPSLSDFPDWVKSILSDLEQQQIETFEKQRTQIRSLPNMNFNLERILKKININNVEQFKQNGYLNTFIELVKQGYDASELLLYRLYCAIDNKLIYQLTKREKIALLKEANQALYDASLRYRFCIPE